MMRSLLDLERYTVAAIDGDIGNVVNFLIDDERWTVRYLVVDTAGHLDGRQVLISPISFGGINWKTRRFELKLTGDKVNRSPGIDTALPVSRQRERDFHRYYGYPVYWGDSGLWGMGAYPGVLETGPWVEPAGLEAETLGDAHLRSANDVRGYHIQGSDGAIGHVEDFVVDDETWALRYLAIDTRNWWFGKKVLVAPAWATRVSWGEHKVHVALSRQVIKDSPEWNGSLDINRDYETRLHAHYGRPAYWQDNAQAAARPLAHRPENSIR
jgi:hypothetical protein